MSLEGRTLHDIMTNENENDETKRAFEKSLQVYLQTSVETACPLPTDECPVAGNSKNNAAFTFTDVTIAQQDFVVFDTSNVAEENKVTAGSTINNNIVLVKGRGQLLGSSIPCIECIAENALLDTTTIAAAATATADTNRSSSRNSPQLRRDDTRTRHGREMSTTTKLLNYLKSTGATSYDDDNDKASYLQSIEYLSASVMETYFSIECTSLSAYHNYDGCTSPLFDPATATTASATCPAREITTFSSGNDVNQKCYQVVEMELFVTLQHQTQGDEEEQYKMNNIVLNSYQSAIQQYLQEYMDISCPLEVDCPKNNTTTTSENNNSAATNSTENSVFMFTDVRVIDQEIVIASSRNDGVTSFSSPTSLFTNPITGNGSSDVTAAAPFQSSLPSSSPTILSSSISTADPSAVSPNQVTEKNNNTINPLISMPPSTILTTVSPTAPTAVFESPSSAPVSLPSFSPLAKLETLPPVAMLSILPSNSPTTIILSSFPTTSVPTVPLPKIIPTDVPSTGKPTDFPTTSTSSAPSYVPTLAMTTKAPTQIMQSSKPTILPTTTSPATHLPTLLPALSSTISPSVNPTISPTTSPSMIPTFTPTKSPSYNPSMKPTDPPTKVPTDSPTKDPTDSPTKLPTDSPVTNSPTDSPVKPTLYPTTAQPSTDVPTHLPTTTTQPTTYSLTILPSATSTNEQPTKVRTTATPSITHFPSSTPIMT